MLDMGSCSSRGNLQTLARLPALVSSIDAYCLVRRLFVTIVILQRDVRPNDRLGKNGEALARQSERPCQLVGSFGNNEMVEDLQKNLIGGVENWRLALHGLAVVLACGRAGLLCRGRRNGEQR